MSETRTDTRVADRLAELLRRHRLRRDFPPEVAAEVRHYQAHPGIDAADLTDRSNLAFVTIDNPDSGDLDQALYIEEVNEQHRGNARYRIYYALADGSYYVPPGSALFDEAVRRGVTQYLPGFSIPMLPPELSEGLVSLNEGCLRRALLFCITLDGHGECLESTFERARVRSRAKLNYGEVQEYLDAADRSTHRLGSREFSDSLALLQQVGSIRIHRAVQRDVVQYDREEIDVLPAQDDSHKLRVVARRRHAVEEWNAQISLMCNIEGAGFLARHRDPDLDIEGIFRVHPPPTAAAIEGFADWLGQFVRGLGLDEHVWHWRRGYPQRESLADYIARLPDDGAAARISMAVQRQAMLLNRQAEYSVDRAAHHAIGTPQYSRFSSPMREVVGILTHHLAIRQQQHLAMDVDRSMIDRVVEAGNRTSALQKQVGRETLKIAIDDLLHDDLAEIRQTGSAPVRVGTLMGATRSRLHVRLDDPPVDLKLYLEELRERFSLDLIVSEDETRVFAGIEAETRQVANLGGAIRVTTVGYDEKRERWLLKPIIEAGSGN